MTNKELYDKYLCNVRTKDQIELYQRPNELIEFIEMQHNKLYPNETIDAKEVAAKIWQYMSED